LVQIRRGIGKFSKLRSHGLEIEDTPKPRDEAGKTLEEFHKEKDLLRNRVYTLLSALTEKNIDVLEEISKWNELMPSIQNFKEWTKERCKDAQRSYRDEQLDPIVDMFIAAFANSNKTIKDGYDSQVKDYDHQLNGYTKETSYGTKRFFGADEIRQMFESATLELLCKIAGIIADYGFKDVKEWMQSRPWYREFELGREVERKLRRERKWER